jgi:hypothetical protein
MQYKFLSTAMKEQRSGGGGGMLLERVHAVILLLCNEMELAWSRLRCFALFGFILTYYLPVNRAGKYVGYLYVCMYVYIYI